MRLTFFLLVVLLLCECARPTPAFQEVDWDVWKSDPDGCAGKRIAFVEPLQRQRDLFKSLSEMDIVKLMGKPDQNELYQRNQKFYSYFFQAGTECDHPHEGALRIIIRFNAMGLAKEITIE